MSQVKLAKRVLWDYASGSELLSDDECSKLVSEGHDGENLTLPQCTLLQGVLGKGGEGEITPQEKSWLEQSDLHEKFIKTIYGKSGKKPMLYRASWLNGAYLRQSDPASKKSRALIEEIFDIGPYAREAVPALRKVIGDPDCPNRASVISVLGDIGSKAAKAIPEIAARLKDPKEADIVRLAAAIALGKIGQKKIAAAALASVLWTAPDAVRVQAVDSLVKLRATEFVRDLILIYKGADSENPLIKEAVEKAFEALNVSDNMKIVQLIEVLEGKDKKIAVYAANVLGRMGIKAKKAIQPLSDMLDDTDQEMRDMAAFALTMIATADVLRGIGDGGKVQAMEAVGDAGTVEAIDVLVELLDHPEVKMRREAIKQLGKEKNLSEAAVMGMVHALDDSDVNVRFAAVERLGLLEAGYAVPGLVKALNDTSLEIRKSAVSSLKVKGAEAEAAIGKLSKMLLSDEEGAELKIEIAIALGIIGSKKAVNPLLKGYKKYTGQLKEECAVSLGSLGKLAKSAFNPLANSIRHLDDDMAAIIVDALMLIDKKRAEKVQRILGSRSRLAIPALIDAARDPDPNVRLAAVRALGKIGPEARSDDVERTLTKATEDMNRKVRVAAVRALGEIFAEEEVAVTPEPADKGVEETGGFGMPDPLANPTAPPPAETPPVAPTPVKTDDDVVSGDTVKDHIAVLKDGKADIDDRATAATALGATGGKKAASALFKSLGNEEYAIRNAVAKALIKNPEQCKRFIPKMVRMVAKGNENKRAGAVYVLSSLGADVADLLPALMKIVSGGNERRSIAAVYIIGTIGPKAGKSIPTILKLTQSESKKMRKEAVNALKGIVPDSPFAKYMRDIRDPSHEKRMEAGKGIVVMGDRAVSLVPALVKALKGDDDNARSGAVYVLAGLGAVASGATSALIKMVKRGNEKKRVTAIYLLGMIGPKARKAVPYIRAAARQGSKRVKKEAKRALESIRGK